MSFRERYRGSFLDAGGVAWTCVIEQEAGEDFARVGELDFPKKAKPLVIEWEGRDKEESVCGSVATLRVYSPGDRTYEGV